MMETEQLEVIESEGDGWIRVSANYSQCILDRMCKMIILVLFDDLIYLICFLGLIATVKFLLKWVAIVIRLSSFWRNLL